MDQNNKDDILKEEKQELPKKRKKAKVKKSGGSSPDSSDNYQSTGTSSRNTTSTPKAPVRAKGGYKKKGGAGGKRTGAGRKPKLNQYGNPKETIKKAVARSPKIKQEIYRFRRLQTKLNNMNALNKVVADLSGNFKAQENGLAKKSKLDYFRGKSGRISLETLRKYNKDLERQLADVGLVKGTKSNRRVNKKVLSNDEYFKRTLKEWLEEQDFAGILFVNSETDMDAAEEFAMEHNYLVRNINDITSRTNKVNISKIAQEVDWIEVMYD